LPVFYPSKSEAAREGFIVFHQSRQKDFLTVARTRKREANRSDAERTGKSCKTDFPTTIAFFPVPML